MSSELRLRLCTRPACDARRNQSRTGSCCDGISVSFLDQRLATDSTQRDVLQLSRKSRTPIRRFPIILVMSLDPLPAYDYNTLSPNGKPLLGERSVSVRKCLRLDCLRVVPHQLRSCPRRPTRYWPARRNAAPLQLLRLRAAPPHQARRLVAPLRPMPKALTATS